MKPKLTFFTGLLALILTGCEQPSTYFKLRPAESTGIDFANTITTNDSLNALNFEYIYNGAGVAAGDLNNDGLVDLFFTGNQVSSKLYLNEGALSFKEVTERAGVGTDRWCTGVAMVDINDDGRLDIYVSVAGFEVPEKAMENLLFINQGWGNDGVPIFIESAADYGLNDAGYSTQAAFFDYDLDGDLDLYLLTNAKEDFNRNNLVPRQLDGSSKSTDRLYRNNGDQTFTNVSREAGILVEGYGLGVNIADLNLDGLPDIYVANDFLSNDLIWMNQGDGTFSNEAATLLKHQTHNGMGVDVADFNNDGLPDITVLDMLPADNFRQKMMVPKVNYDKFQMKRELGYEDQYMRNTVQLHQGLAPDGSPRFSEIGNLLGMAATDWSWSVLFADLDNDGWKDAYITNGYRKDITNLDFINYSYYNQMFGSVEAKKQKAIDELEKIAEVEVSNYLFHNQGGWQFENATTAWGLEKASFSNGAVYADLDNDGDLDLVTNNIDAPAFVFENMLQSGSDNKHYLQIQLREDEPGLTAYNAKVFLYSGGQLQYQELSPCRGFKSSTPDLLHFGMGAAAHADSVIVYWLNGKKSTLSDVAADQRLVINYRDAERAPVKKRLPRTTQSLFAAADEARGIRFIHANHPHTDLKTTRTMVLDPAKAGPALATGDINGDGLEDFFVGGNLGQAGQFFTQQASGLFTSRTMLFDSSYQDVDALFFDADNDGDNDLYVVSGGTHEVPAGSSYQDRLYLNDGRGNFRHAAEALPTMFTPGSCVRAADYDGDGDLDLFIGGRIAPGQYPLAPRSYLLRNQNGRFEDVTPDDLRRPGMITDAAWGDINGDRLPDLVFVGEWLPILVYENAGTGLRPMKIKLSNGLQANHGWWMHLNLADLDQDGDLDLLVGNLGLNSKLQANSTRPLSLYAKDFDDNGAIDPLLSCYISGAEHLLHERDLLIDQIPGMKRRFKDYRSYAEADLAHTLSEEDLEDATILKADQLASVILENEGDGNFTMQSLPVSAQISPIMSSMIIDLDRDGREEILLSGNLHAVETNQVGWFDASYGTILRPVGHLEFTVVGGLYHGLALDGDIRVAKKLKLGSGENLFLFGRYGGPLAAYTRTVPPWVSYTLNTN